MVLSRSFYDPVHLWHVSAFLSSNRKAATETIHNYPFDDSLILLFCFSNPYSNCNDTESLTVFRALLTSGR